MEDKLKIVYLIARFHPFKGGAEQNCYQLATSMAAVGHDVTVLTTDATPDGRRLPPKEVIMGVKVVRLHRLNQQLNLGFYPSLLPILLKTDADVIHAENGPGFIWHDFCLWVKKLSSRHTKFLVTPHGPFLSTPKNYRGWKYNAVLILKLLMAPYFRIFWARLWDVVIQVNPKQIKWLTRDYGISENKIRLLPNGIDQSLIEKVLPEKKEPPIVITFVGRLARYKGVQHVLHALRKVLDTHPELAASTKFIAMGKPEVYFSELKKLTQHLNLQDNVEFLISPTDSERDRILSEVSQIHILPSEWEATGIVLLEAMAKGNALISSNTNEAAEFVIEHGTNGFIFDYGDDGELAEYIHRLLVDKGLRQRMMKASLSLAHNHTWEAILPQYQEMLSVLVS